MRKGWSIFLGAILVAELAYYVYKPRITQASILKEAVVEFNIDVSTYVAIPPFETLVKVPFGSWRGTGFMVSPDGFIITCAHVVLPEKEGDVDVKVSFFGVPGRYVTPHIIYVNKAMDIALVKVDVPVILPYLRLGSGESTQPGDPVTSMGHPAGYDWSVYSNKISAKRFVNTHLVGEDDEKVEVEQYEFQLQTPMLPGISGAPVVDEHGEVVCMVNLAFMPKHGAEIDFCIPVEEIKWVMETQGLR